MPGQLLAAFGATPQSLQAAAQGETQQQTAGTAESGSATPTLDQFGLDLTAKAREGALDPVIGRADEVAQTVEILLRRTKNNPVLIGEPGVGKTAIAEGLAQRIQQGDIPDILEDKRVLTLDIGLLVAGTKYRVNSKNGLKRSWRRSRPLEM